MKKHTTTDYTSNLKIQRILRIVECMVWVFLVVYGLQIVHRFSQYIDIYPYVAVDDGLANISYAVAEEGRLGFLSSPVQSLSGVPRNENYFNHGPWYFLFGGGLIWLFGGSLTLIRWIHPLVVFALVILAYRWFKGSVGRIGGALFVFLILHAFDSAHWPMARPDISVSLFLVLFFIACGQAIRTHRPRWWVAAAFFSVCAAFAHLIAWSIIPASLVAFGMAAWWDWNRGGPDRAKRLLRSGLAFSTGWGIGILHFLVLIRFNIRDLVELSFAYNDQLSADYPGYAAVLKKHLFLAFYYVPGWFHVVIAALCMAAAVWSLSMWWKGGERARPALIYVLPPAVALTFHLLSSGIYNNYHAGYSTIIHTLVFWTLAGLYHGAVTQASARQAKTCAALSIVLGLMISSAVGILVWRTSIEPSHRENLARQWTPFSDYSDRVLAPIPQAATAWGSIYFGIEHPRRIQLIQFLEALSLYGRIPVPERSAYTPDFIVWGPVENSSVARSILLGIPFLEPVADWMENVRFDLVSLTVGPPYGVTRVYRKWESGDGNSIEPVVRMYDPKRRRWSHSVADRIQVSWTEILPVTVRWNAETPARTASRSWHAELAPGDYLFRLRFASDVLSKETLGIALVCPAGNVEKLLGDQATPTFDVSPYVLPFHGDYLIHRHPGGPLSVNLLDAGAAASLEAIDVYPITYLNTPNRRAEKNLYTDRLIDEGLNVRNRNE